VFIQDNEVAATNAGINTEQIGSFKSIQVYKDNKDDTISGGNSNDKRLASF
jgi:hypothetical protein